MTPIDRYEARVRRPQGLLACWRWGGSRTKKGYPAFRASGHISAHRFAYTWWRGTIPHGMQLDHLCRIRDCSNPWHLEPVTNLENCRRGLSGELTRQRQIAKAHCPSGHPYRGDNLYTNPRGWRFCRTCSRDFDKRRRPSKAKAP